MITAGVEFCNNMINALLAGDGFSDTLSPVMIVTGPVVPNVANLQLNFGDFVQLQMNNNPTNTMLPRHIDCIALHPTGSTQGLYYFIALHSGKRQHGRQWTRCVMTDDIISWVEALSRAQTQPIIYDGPIVRWRNGEPITPAVVPDVDAVTGDQDADPSNLPLFLPPPPPTLDVEADISADVPLRIVLVDVGANIVPDQGAADHAVLHNNDDDDVFEGVLYELPDDERDANGTTDGKVEGAQHYNLRQRGYLFPTFSKMVRFAPYKQIRNSVQFK